MRRRVYISAAILATAALLAAARAPAAEHPGPSAYDWPGLTPEERAVVDPPPISFVAEGVTMEELAAILSRATGASITAQLNPESTLNQARFSAHVVNQTFWDAFSEITPVGRNQDTLGLGEPGFRLQRGTITVGSHDWTAGGFRVVPLSFLRQRTVQLAQKPEDVKQQTLQFNYQFVIDPRIWVLRTSVPRILSAADDTGHDLVSDAEHERLKKVVAPTLPQNTTNMALSIIREYQVFKPDDTLGKKLTVRGDVRFEVVMEQRPIEIADIRAATESVIAGGFRVSFSSSDGGNGFTGFSVMVEADGNLPSRNGAKLRIQDMADDGAGIIWEGTVAETRTLNFLARVKGPVHATLVDPVRTKVIQLPFELKNLEIPP